MKTLFYIFYFLTRNDLVIKLFNILKVNASHIYYIGQFRPPHFGPISIQSLLIHFYVYILSQRIGYFKVRCEILLMPALRFHTEPREFYRSEKSKEASACSARQHRHYQSNSPNQWCPPQPNSKICAPRLTVSTGTAIRE